MLPARLFPPRFSLRPAGAALLFLCALAGCAAQVPAAAPVSVGPVVQVFKSRGAVQCGDRGVAPDAMRAELERAGVRVQASACGTDGRMRAAVCGGGTGEINLFDIAAADLGRAQGLGFAPLSQLRGEAQTVPCR